MAPIKILKMPKQKKSLSKLSKPKRPHHFYHDEGIKNQAETDKIYPRSSTELILQAQVFS